MEDASIRRLGNWPAQLDARFERFVTYWASKRSPNGVVLKRRIDPTEIAPLLPGIMIVEQIANARTDGSVRYRYRLAGGLHYDRNGMELTGRWFDEVQRSDAVPELEADFEEILRTGGVHYKVSPNLTKNRDYQSFERVLCPISLDGEINSMLIGYYIWRN